MPARQCALNVCGERVGPGERAHDDHDLDPYRQHDEQYLTLMLARPCCVSLQREQRDHQRAGIVLDGADLERGFFVIEDRRDQRPDHPEHPAQGGTGGNDAAGGGRGWRRPVRGQRREPLGDNVASTGKKASAVREALVVSISGGGGGHGTVAAGRQWNGSGGGGLAPGQRR